MRIRFASEACSATIPGPSLPPSKMQAVFCHSQSHANLFSGGPPHDTTFLDGMARMLGATPSQAQYRRRRHQCQRRMRSTAAYMASPPLGTAADPEAAHAPAYEQTPLLDAVAETAGRTQDVPLHVPGHKVCTGIRGICHHNVAVLEHRHGGRTRDASDLREGMLLAAGRRSAPQDASSPGAERPPARSDRTARCTNTFTPMQAALKRGALKPLSTVTAKVSSA